MHREHSRNPDPTDLVTLGKLCFAKGLVLGRPRFRLIEAPFPPTTEDIGVPVEIGQGLTQRSRVSQGGLY